ncbi:multicomponent Na+:H+ antiporter subunit E [Natranaerovirga hydrolytica]|uniref:Multicomponent Na+:H+ antiporter subunit E n=1 Tax=Natranaerovirga hydrolytica TaxID=680378 RepID=A0A4R1N3F9_9FIRM|nr:Na+/H+ antiporter subunit E [Natranaerovirga hydrolytica]TCK98584.1 multicomponent Na+:H+ antiporter subunit E [Natranaerovirga hydrolytica]
MKNMIWPAILLFFWIGLTQSLDSIDVIMGLIISVISFALAKKFFTSNSSYPKLNVIKVIQYIFMVFIQMIKSGFESLYMLVTRKSQVKIIKVPTDFPSDFYVFVLAISITLTPGTVTIYRKNSTLYVLRLFPKHSDPEKEPEAIKTPFEKLLLKD